MLISLGDLDWGALTEVIPTLLGDPAKAIEYVRVDTTLAPPVTMLDPLRSPTGPSKVGPLLGLLRPQITLKLYGMSQPVVMAPWGNPGRSLWPWVAGLAMVGGGVVAYSVIKLIFGKRS